jgi:Ca2+-binding RTX toxin-like protein
MRGRVCFAALVAAAVFAAPAQASTLTATGLGAVTFTAGAGETNTVTVSLISSFQLNVTDLAGVTAGSGCTQDTATTAHCSVLNSPGMTFALGDQADSLTYTESAFGYNGMVFNGGTGNDTITVTSGRNVTINGEGGDDNLTGGPGFDTINGGVGADTLSGAGGNDGLDGGDENDWLVGGDGNDSLLGGAGTDLLQGATGNDTIEGGAGPDNYFGGDGDDLLRNSYHNDDLNGNAGTDTVDYSLIGASFDLGCVPVTDCPIGVVVTFDNTGNDGSYDLDSAGDYIAADNVHTDVEVVIGTPHPDTLNGAAPVMLEPLNQTFSGGGGNDTITGGPGTDLLRESGGPISVPITVTLTNGMLTGYFGTDTFTGIESAELNGGARDDTIDASAYSSPVTLRGGVGVSGGDGNDRLIGGSGNDTIVGGDACCLYQDSDTLTGGPGDDTLDFGFTFGFDQVAESGDVNFALTNAQLTGLGTDTFVGVANGATLTGGAGNNTLNASAFTNGPVTLDGGAGIDTLQGGSQPDTLTGGAGNDTIDGAGSATDRLVETADSNMTLSDGALVGPATGTDSIANVELATLNGGPGANVLSASGFSAPVTINGLDGADTLTGGSVADTLNGGDGNDTLNGGGSVDAVNGGDGDDTLDGGADAVNDVLHGDAGTNRVVASGNSNFTLTDTTLFGFGTDGLFEIQRATLTGGAGDNALNASTFTLGQVILIGGAGADSLLGGSGGDTLTGGPGVDTFDAGAGNDLVDAFDGVAEASVSCGADADEAKADPADTVNPDCETLADVLAPNTKLTKGPKAKTKSHKTKFTFKSTEAGSRFQCKLDRKAWKGCKSGVTYKRLKKGKHTFRVRAIDAAGNVDQTPAKKTWRIR